MNYPPTRTDCKRYVLFRRIYRAINASAFLASVGMLLIAVYMYFGPSDVIDNQSSIAAWLVVTSVCAGAVSFDQIKVLTKDILWGEAHLVRGCVD